MGPSVQAPAYCRRYGSPLALYLLIAPQVLARSIFITDV